MASPDRFQCAENSLHSLALLSSEAVPDMKPNPNGNLVFLCPWHPLFTYTLVCIPRLTHTIPHYCQHWKPMKVK